MLIANYAGSLAESLLANVDNAAVMSVWVGVLFYAFQIYFDFSGYSDMAIGLGHMFGFDYPENFKYPYISTSITDFWRRWHITLSSFFRDYVYIPSAETESACRVRYSIFSSSGVSRDSGTARAGTS